ncbi:MAG TPA: GAF domain-containing sensor histidine kinase [Actinomycetota bacterium]|nr:GAF domain-containing sensor histidine kinase [Actinomycetota bacterium]
MSNDDVVTERMQQEARVAGLRDFRTPSLEAVEKRRLQLWILTAVLLVSISLGIVFVSTWQTSATRAFASTPVLRIAVVLLSMAFAVYAIEKERHLRKLSRLLVDERVLTTALSNRLREVELLLGAGKAMNDVLELSVVLQTILHSAVELLGSESGSVMLVEGDHDLGVAVSTGNDRATGGKVRLGEGIAGHVASTREALLVQGKADPAVFPGLVPHEAPVASAISAPLIHRDELLGVLNVNSNEDKLFTEYDLRAVSLFAEQAAAAIANARLYEVERAQVEELTHLNRMKSEFVALVSHELRTPIASIIGAVSTARKPEMQAHRAELEDIVERAALRLGTMVEDLLSAAELERGEAVRRLVPVDLAKVVQEAAADHAVLDRDVQVEAPQAAVVVCDREYVRRILDNLVDNAFKYGSPPVRVEVTGDAASVTLSVLDAGRGVAAADREKVFDRFHRLDTMNGHGLGLGLSVVQGLVEAMEGTIRVEEAPGGGAAFRITFPRPERTLLEDALTDALAPTASTPAAGTPSVS